MGLHSFDEAAGLLGLSVHSLRRLIWAGTLPGVRVTRRVQVDLRDGIKVYDERGWVQVVPDPDEPLIHVYAEGETEDSSHELEHDLHQVLSELIGREEIGTRS